METLGVLFDMDGVLVDSYQAHLLSWRRLAERHGVEMTEEQFAQTFGWTSRQIIRHYWPQRVRPEDVPIWDAEKEALYREILLEDFPEMPGAGDLIASLHAAGFRMAIASSGPPENVRAVLDRLPHRERIAAAVDGMQVTRGKPDPEVFLLAAEKIDLPAARCAVIEDAPAGIEAARRAGMIAIALTGTVEAPRLADAHAIVDSLAELTPRRIADLIHRSDPA